MWHEELHAFLVPLQGPSTSAGSAFQLAQRGVLELPPFPKTAQSSRPLQSPPVLVGRHTPCLYWALGNRLSCPRYVFELTTWSHTHLMPYPVPSLAPLHNAGVRLRCVDRAKCVRFVARRSPPMESGTDSSASRSVGPFGFSRTLEEGEHVWLEPGDRLLLCDTLLLELVVFATVRTSPLTVGPSDVPAEALVMRVVSPEGGAGAMRVSMPAVPWQRLSRQTRTALAAKAVEHAQWQRESRRATKSSSSRAEEELVHTNGRSSQGDRADRAGGCTEPAELSRVRSASVSSSTASARETTHPTRLDGANVRAGEQVVDEERGAATPSRQNSQTPSVPPLIGRQEVVSSRSKGRRLEPPRDAPPPTGSVHSASTPVKHSRPPQSLEAETLDALQLRTRSSQVAASSGTNTQPTGVPDSYQSGDSVVNDHDADSGSTVLAKNSYLETFDEHLNEALMQLENRSAEMNANWLLQSGALFGGATDVLGGEPLRDDAQLKAVKSVSPSRKSPSHGSARKRRASKSKSKTPRGTNRRGRKSPGPAKSTSADSDKPLNPITPHSPFQGAAESQEVFFQH